MVQITVNHRKILYGKLWKLNVSVMSPLTWCKCKYYIIAVVYTEFNLVWLWRKLLAYRNTLESVPGTNQYWAISVWFLAQGNNGLSMTGFEPMRLAILRLLVRRVNHSTTPPLCCCCKCYPGKYRHAMSLWRTIHWISYLYVL